MSGVDHLTQAIDVLLETEPNYEYRALVNNAAKLLGPAFGQTNARAFDDYFAINTRAPFFLGQHASEHLQEGGCIVNISSASAHISSPGDIVYAMSKASIESFTANAAEALARKGIRINNVVPGFTDNGNHAFKDPRVLEYMSTFSALGDVARPSVVAEAVSFLISDAASRTTGATLDVSGGMLLGLRGHREGSVKALLTEQ